MHELAVTRSLVDLVQTESERQGFTKALEIRLKVGEYSGIVPDYILDLFPYASRGTAAEGAALISVTAAGTTVSGIVGAAIVAGVAVLICLIGGFFRKRKIKTE